MRSIAALLLIAALIVPGTAAGATLGRTGDELRYQAAPGEENQFELRLTADGKELHVRGYAAHLPSAGPGCRSDPEYPGVRDDVYCPIDGITRIDFELGDASDAVEALLPESAPPISVHGGDGVDVASYVPWEPAPLGVRVSLDGMPNDGYGGHGDNVDADVESINGSGGSDELTGNNGPNHLYGGFGSDIYRAAGGDDRIDSIEYGPCGSHGGPCTYAESDLVACGSGFDRVEADETDDVDRSCEIVAVNSRIDLTNRADRFTLYRSSLSVFGRGGNDRITGFAEDRPGGQSHDRIDGGRGNDVLVGRDVQDDLTGGPGRDRVSAGRRNDTIRVRDGQRDSVVCGRGRDRVFADLNDRVAKDCERVRRRKA